jgi:hypothetical protein
MTDFFNKDYKVPVTSNYLKLTEGSHKFRILSSAITGYSYFTADNKPVRSPEPFDETPNIKADGKINHFWSFVVYNYDAERIQILDITQKSIQGQMKDYIDSPDWGSPFDYDFTIIRKGTGKMDTEYKVITSPHKELDKTIKALYENSNINLSALYEGQDPFK